jgi:hypothetical protein
MKPKLEQSTVKRNKTMLHNGGRTTFDHQLISDMELVTRINQALAGNGLRLQPTRRESITHAGRTGYDVVYKERTFNLWIGIEDFARALGILNAPAMVRRHVRTRP